MISQNEKGENHNGSLGILAFTEVGKVASCRSVLMGLFWESGQHLFPSCWSSTAITAQWSAEMTVSSSIATSFAATWTKFA